MQNCYLNECSDGESTLIGVVSDCSVVFIGGYIRAFLAALGCECVLHSVNDVFSVHDTNKYDSVG